MKVVWGIVAAYSEGLASTSFKKANRSPPMIGFPVSKARLYPTSAQITLTRAISMKLCIIVARTFFRRTSPP